ncbi:MAG: class I SAM-dependent methyltransferase [Clostridia bacterium]|nr:class I SAM-dependent methyltransferase [Clostridia bacterium]
MTDFHYAHKNTQEGERVTKTAPFNKPQISEEILSLRQNAFMAEIPVSDDETLNFLTTLVSALKPERILELGTAVGASGAAMLEACSVAHLTTVERDEDFYKAAVGNFNMLNLSKRVTAISGDAGEVINGLPENSFDFIFLDCAKVQYIKYLPRLKKLLKKGGVLLADDILLFGYITGEAEVPKKRKMLVEHIKEYISAVTNDGELYTTVLDIGNGVAMSVKK